MAFWNTRKLILLTTCTVAMVGFWQAAQSSTAAESRHKRTISYQDKNDLFYNYYVGPYPCGTVAAMYVSPLPVPANVGHTYTTYQPLMPHEFLYRHHRRYHRYYNEGRGLTRTSVIWW